VSISNRDPPRESCSDECGLSMEHRRGHSFATGSALEMIPQPPPNANQALDSDELGERNHSSPGQCPLDLATAERQRSISAVISRLSHDVSQPLTSIANYLQGCELYLRSGASSRVELHDAMRQALAEVLRVSDILRHYEELAMPHPTGASACSVNDLVLQAIDLEHAEMLQHQMNVSLHLAAGLPPVLADQDQVRSVLVHLLRNAREAMCGTAPDDRHLMIESLLTGKNVLVRISDSGPPIDRTALDQMFEPFVTTKPGHLGLGLCICQSLLKAQAGRLWAELNPTGGLSVQFQLPASESP
jgi:C4-dicarboxylate-specific signal transduction histidine kinase